MKPDVKEEEIRLNFKEEEVEAGADEQAESELSEQERQEAVEKAETIEAIKKFTEEDDMGEISIKSILGGDILQSKFFRNQILWFFLVMVLMLVYTGNRYASQQDSITIDSLRNELQEVKYNVLTQSSELMNLSRQSNVEHFLRQTNDSTLKDPTTPPYMIKRDDEN